MDNKRVAIPKQRQLILKNNESVGTPFYMPGENQIRCYTSETKGSVTTVEQTLFGDEYTGLIDSKDDIERHLGGLAIGHAVAVGTASRFGISELYPHGLAAIGNTLYCAGSAGDYLFSINPNTGVGTRIGSATGFGVTPQITQPRGLAAIGNTLYMIDNTHLRLNTVNTTTGVATPITTSNFKGELLPTGLAAIGNTLYMVGYQTDRLYSMDPSTGVATAIGPSGFGTDENGASGLAAFGDTLYMVSVKFNNAKLYTVNPQTGIAKLVNPNEPSGFGVGEKAPYGLAFIGEVLYMVGHSGEKLYRFPAESFVYNWKQEMFQRIDSINRKVSDIDWEEMPNVSDTTKWLGGKVHDRQTLSEDVDSKDEALKWLNAYRDSTKTYYFYNADASRIERVSAFTATGDTAWPQVASKPVRVILESLCVEMEGGSARTKDKWLRDPTFNVTTEGWTPTIGDKETPIRLRVVDQSGHAVATHPIEAVLEPNFRWTKTPIW